MELRGLRGTVSPSEVVLSYKEYLDGLKIDLNAAKIITAQDYKRTKN